MKKIFPLTFFLFLFAATTAFANDDSVGECYRTMTKKEDLRDCLTLELKEVQAQYNSVLERMQAKARSFDRANKKKNTAKDLADANRNFNAYMKSECELRGALEGDENGEAEVTLACRINMMRERKSALETDLLNAQ